MLLAWTGTPEVAISGPSGNKAGKAIVMDFSIATNPQTAVGNGHDHLSPFGRYKIKSAVRIFES
jgi:hypothetical protein